MPTFTYPANADLQLIAQEKLPMLTLNDPIFTHFPLRNVDASLVMWELRDNYTGLQQIRGMNGEPPSVKQLGAKQFQMRPGVYGEWAMIDELALTERRAYGTFNAVMSISDLVMAKQDHLMGRQVDRMRWILWTLVTTGTFSVPGPSGAILATDTYTTQTFTAAVTWATFATATPLADFSAVALLARGHGVSFGAGSTAYMNRVTFNNLRQNTNNADIFGRRTQGLGTFNSLDTINTLLQADDLPGIVIWDDGYLAETTGTFTPFIPNNKVVVIGRRPVGTTIGEMQITRNANNADLGPGPYTKVIDNGDEEVPRMIQVHSGWNGGPAIYYPSAIVLMTV